MWPATFALSFSKTSACVNSRVGVFILALTTASSNFSAMVPVIETLATSSSVSLSHAALAEDVGTGCAGVEAAAGCEPVAAAALV